MSIKIDLKQELLKRKTFSIPAVQKELSVNYKELRNSVREMENKGQITLTDDELTYLVVDNPSSTTKQYSKSNTSATATNQQVHSAKSAPDMSGEISVDEIIARRRKEILERIDKLNEEDEANENEDDEENVDESDDDLYNFRRKIMERLENLSEEDEENDENDEIDVTLITKDACNGFDENISDAKDCKLIDGINYSDDINNAKKITDKLAESGYILTLKAIQYGTASTRYVFDYPAQNRDIKDISRFVSDIKLSVKADKVNVVAPWSDATVCVLVHHNAAFDSLCKRVLKYWVMRNGGRASIASVQRGLGIGFNRAGKIMECLQKFGCVEQLSPSDDVSKPLHVKINLQEIGILFPKSLGWE